MARILSIDSSIPNGSVALLDGIRVLSQTFFNKAEPSSQSLLSSVDRVFLDSRSGLGDLDGFAVVTGPGSFTGLRVGVSLIKGLVMATHKPFVPVDTLEALALLVEPCDHLICPMLDARKQEVYAAFFRYRGDDLERLTPDEAVAPETLAERISEPVLFVGQGVEIYGECLAKKMGERFIRSATLKSHSTAASAGIIASAKFETLKFNDLDQLNIRYVRKSEAELNFGRI